MKNIKNTLLPVSLIVVCFLFSFFDAHAQKPPASWMTNSLKIDSISPGTHFHAEGDYTFYTSKGNVDMTMHRGSPRIFIRNGRYLFETLGSINYQRIQSGRNPETKTHVFSLNPKLIYDLTPTFQSESGILWEKDDGHFLDLRSIYYTGLIFNKMDSKTLGSLFFLAGGYQTVKSTELPAQLATFIGADVVTNEKFILYAMQSFSLKVSPKLQLIEKFTYIQSLDNSQTYRTDLELKAQFVLTKYLSGLVAYQAKYQKFPLIPELAPFVDRLNTSLTFGVKVNI
jgi:hypothetical protein